MSVDLGQIDEFRFSQNFNTLVENQFLSGTIYPQLWSLYRPEGERVIPFRDLSDSEREKMLTQSKQALLTGRYAVLGNSLDNSK